MWKINLVCLFSIAVAFQNTGYTEHSFVILLLKDVRAGAMHANTQAIMCQTFKVETSCSALYCIGQTVQSF